MKLIKTSCINICVYVFGMLYYAGKIILGDVMCIRCMVSLRTGRRHLLIFSTFGAVLK